MLTFKHLHDKYKEHGLVELDYIISKEKLNLNGWQLQSELTMGFFLFEKIK
jgi:hypothetical protein